MDKWRVSVVIPTFNGERYLAAAIESVKSQGSDIAEIIIVDDGSKTPVSELKSLNKEGVKIIRQENKGQGSAINTGVRTAQGELLAFLDHDDYWAPNKIGCQKSILLENSLDVVVGEVVNEWSLRDVISSSVNMGPARVFGACLFRKSAFLEVGPVAEDRHIHEVIDWWSRANGKLKVGYSNEVALFRRIHGENQTLKKENVDKGDLFRRVRENIERNHSNL